MGAVRVRGSRGGHTKSFMLGFSPIFQGFSGPPAGLTLIILEAAGRPDINN